MAGASLLTLLDDIAAVLDDVAVMTKVAAKKSAAVADDVSAMTKVATRKTAGVLGDDLALNAQQVTGVRAERELPVVWAVAKGSLMNKVILVPAALAISLFLPWLITPLLMVGGAFLCFEGVEKLAHKFLPQAHAPEQVSENGSAPQDPVALEQEKIKGAVRTDFILSAEIIVIALGTVASAPLLQQVAVLVGIALLMTVGVYGLVAGIVKLDDLGLWLNQKKSALLQVWGRALLVATPWLMRFLSVAGTAAMFLVGGGILVHGVPFLHHAVEAAGAAVAVGDLAGLWQALMVNGLNGVLGIFAGVLVLGAVQLFAKLRPVAA
ncbi:DUF808 domain-containing protein [Azonexus sp.]|uniref:DUF808 domain-containing protein n=1 Tax=Azonexus sp. TaxID=1872668 RepID=UPI0039E50851